MESINLRDYNAFGWQILLKIHLF